MPRTYPPETNLIRLCFVSDHIDDISYGLIFGTLVLVGVTCTLNLSYENLTQSASSNERRVSVMSDKAAKTLSISGCSVATLLTAGETFKSTFKDALIDMLTPHREEPPDAEVLISFLCFGIFLFWNYGLQTSCFLVKPQHLQEPHSQSQ